MEVKTFVLGAQKNHLIEAVLIEYLQHMFYLRNMKNSFNYRLSCRGLNIVEEVPTMTQDSYRNSKTQFHDLSMIFHDQHCNFHDYLMCGLQPPL